MIINELTNKPMKTTLILSAAILLNSLSLHAQEDYSDYFTAVFVGDPHVAQSSGTSVADMQTYVQNIVNMGKTGGLNFQFHSLPGYTVKADIVFCLGDMDKDSETSGNDFKNAFAALNTAHIPFITMVGNHDIVPDYWTGDNPDKGLTYGFNDGGSYCNDVALGIVTDQLNTAKNYEVTDVTRFTDGTTHTQMQPFTFKFNGVRFYVGQTYWFQKPYTKPSLFSSATYYAPDGVISALEAFVNSHTTEPSVWMQHYPIIAGSDTDRWWLDQNDTGMTIAPSNNTAYTTANSKRDKLTEIIKKTKNPVHFSGHTHWYAENEYNGVKDYTVTATMNDNSGAYIVLCSKTEGVKEVKRVNLFTHYAMSTCDDAYDDVVTASVTDIDAAVGHTVQAGEDVTALLGSNLDFETTQESGDATFVNMHRQPEWVNVFSGDANDNNKGYIFTTQQTGQESGAPTSNCLRLRAKWQENTIRNQMLRKTPLPAGSYKLSYYIKASQQNFTQDLNYYEVNGTRTMLAKTTEWTRQSIDFYLSEPSVFTLSFGFVGGDGSKDCEIFVDDITLTYNGTETSPYSKYLFAYFPSNSDENIYYAVSDNGFDYTPVSEKPIISADSVALHKGLRDPHVMRAEDGTFLMVATDMCSADGWSSNRGIVMMKSDDLVNWKYATVNFPTRYAGTQFANVTRVWAPEVIWDKEAQKYMVYFSLLTNDGTISYDKVYRAYANSEFTDLEDEPVWMFDRGAATIDMNIVYNPADQLYHGFYKNENTGGIAKATATSLTGTWGSTTGNLQQTSEAVEGPAVYKLINSSTWVLMYDCYNNNHYQFCTSNDLTTFTFKQNTPTTGAFTPRHGSVILISDEEYETLVNSLSNELERNTKEVEGATADNPILTSFVENGRMNNGTNGWTSTTGAQNQTTATNQGAAFSKPFQENWNPTSFTGKIYQTIGNIPNGTYVLDIAAFVNNFDEAGGQVVYADATEQALIAGDPTTYQLVVYVDDNTLEIGFNQKNAVANWVGIDNVFLTYYGSENVVDEIRDRLLRQPLADEIEKAIALGTDVTAEQVVLERVSLTRNEVEEAVKVLKVKEFETVTAVYSDEQTSLLGDWTTNNQTMNQGQHWDGTETSDYYEQRDGWGSYSWKMSMSQTVTLPAGSYVLKMSGRSASQAVTATMSVDGKSVRFPFNDDHGYGISTDGNACFSPDATYANNNAGRGWEWRYMPFTLGEENSVNIAISAVCDQAVQQWVSFANPTLWRKPAMRGDVNDDGVVDIADITALVNQLTGQPGTPFIRAAADLSGDGEVTIADLPLLVALVLAKE